MKRILNPSVSCHRRTVRRAHQARRSSIKGNSWFVSVTGAIVFPWRVAVRKTKCRRAIEAFRDVNRIAGKVSCSFSFRCHGSSRGWILRMAGVCAVASQTNSKPQRMVGFCRAMLMNLLASICVARISRRASRHTAHRARDEIGRQLPADNREAAPARRSHRRHAAPRPSARPPHPSSA